MRNFLRNITHHILCLALLFTAPMSVMHAAWAQSTSVIHTSKTGIFSTRFPAQPVETISTFDITPDTTISSSNIAVTIPATQNKVAREYRVIFEPTIGPPIAEKQKKEILNGVMDRYAASYADKNGVVKNRKLTRKNGQTAGDIYISYKDPDYGPYAIRAVITLTNTAKFQHIVRGTDAMMLSPKTREFMESLTLLPQSKSSAKPATPSNKKPFSTWQDLRTPSKIFALQTPPITAPYFTFQPRVQSNDKKERLSLAFNDPLRAEQIFYNVTGYKFDREIGFEEAQKVFVENHIRAKRQNLQGIQIDKGFLGDTPIMEVTYSIRPPQGYPYMNAVMLRGMFSGNYLVVQEAMGGIALVSSPFAKTVFDLIDFTPEKALKAYVVDRLKERIAQ